jgi:uncharacterized SAM-binding protein YcdF (DUF218 family)
VLHLGPRRCLFTAVALVLVCAALTLSDAPARWLTVDDDGRSADAVVVLAGDRDYERTATGAALILAGRARLLILTGGISGPGDSASSLRDEALRRGVAPDRIRMEAISRSTREAMIAIEPLLRQERARHVVLVTSPYHQRRALLAARHALPGVTFSSCAAAPSFWSPLRWWGNALSREIVLSEYEKLAYYCWRGWI